MAIVTLFNFTGANGQNPYGGLIADATGNLYGTTQTGGANGLGSVFKLTPDGHGGYTESIIASFSGTNGQNPWGTLIADALGDLFGTTKAGGANGFGTVFKLTPNGAGGYTETVIASLTGTTGADPGQSPYGSLIADTAGDLFGTTQNGGTNGFGTAFKLTPNGAGGYTETVLANFGNVNDGSKPYASLLADTAGNLFGTTQNGGVNGYGAVFKLTPNGAGGYTESVVYSFQGAPGGFGAPTDGATPSSNLIADSSGNLFGTTQSGGANSEGTVFELTPHGHGGYTESIIYDFQGGADGWLPIGGLIADAAGDLYGTTAYGGASAVGTVFKLTPDGHGGYTESIVASFTGANGSVLTGKLIAVAAGNLFGTTKTGGSSKKGTVFEIVQGDSGFVAPAPVTVTGAQASQAVHDNASLAPFAHVTVADPNAGQTETVTISWTTANGTLSDPNAATDGSGIFNGVYTVTGTAAQVTTALDALVFVPTAHQVAPGHTMTTGFTIAVTDTLGATASDTTTSVVTTAVAASPTITGTQASQSVNDNATLNPFAHVAIADVNAGGQAETVTITLSAIANGTLRDPNAATDGSSIVNGVYAVIGTAAQVTADLNALVFTPTAHQVSVGSTVTTGFTIAVTDTAGAGATDNTTSVIATALAPPVAQTLNVTDTTPGLVGVFDNASVKPFAGLGIADSTSGQASETATIAISNPANGTLSDPNAASDHSTLVNGVYTVTGTAAQVTAELEALVFTPTAHEVAPGSAVSTTFAITLANGAGLNTTTSKTVSTVASGTLVTNLHSAQDTLVYELYQAA